MIQLWPKYKLVIIDIFLVPGFQFIAHKIIYSNYYNNIVENSSPEFVKNIQQVKKNISNRTEYTIKM